MAYAISTCHIALPQDVARDVARVAQDMGLYRQPYAQGPHLERYQKKALDDGVATVPAVEAVEAAEAVCAAQAAQAVCAAQAAQAQAEMPSHHHFKVLVHDWFPDILYMNL